MIFYKAFFFFYFLIFIFGCSEKQQDEIFVQSTLQECQEAEIKNEYLVHNKDGSFAIHKLTLEELQKTIIEPNKELISYYEPHYQLNQLPSPLNEEDDEDEESPVLSNEWALKSINIEEAWQKGWRGQGVRVAVIDTGVDSSHILLSENIEKNLGEMGLDENGEEKSENGKDDDKNGFIDDVTTPLFFKDRSEFSTPHGTHIAGIISSQHNLDTIDPLAVQGLAPSAKIIPIHFISRFEGGTSALALKSIDYAILRKADIINASWGSSHCVKSLEEKINSLAFYDILFVSASGNEGKNIDINPDYPSSFQAPIQVVVGSYGRSLLASDFSNYGVKTVDIFAPGSQIISTFPSNELGFSSGTSMSAPFVSAALALLKSAAPDATASELKSALLLGVSKHPHYLNKTQGRLNIALALEILLKEN